MRLTTLAIAVLAAIALPASGAHAAAAAGPSDFDLDGRADVVAVAGDTAYLLKGDGAGGFAKTTIGTGWISYQTMN